MDDDINNDPDLEEDSIDPFNSDESEIDDSGPEDDPPVGHYSRNLPTINSRPHLTKIYNSEMNSCDVYDQYLHTHSIRYVPMKHKLSWILQPTLSILDYEFLNSFFYSTGK